MNSTQSNPGTGIQEFLAEITLASPIDRWDENTGAVTLMTRARGQGTRVPGRFHRRPGRRPLAPLAGPGRWQRARGRAAALFRRDHPARRELYLSRCRVRSFRGQIQATEPSTFLSELPEGPIVVRDLSGVGSVSCWATRTTTARDLRFRANLGRTGASPAIPADDRR